MNNSRPAELKTLIQTTTGRSSSTNPGSGGVSRPAGNEVPIGNTTNNQPSTQVPTNNQTQIPTRSTK